MKLFVGLGNHGKKYACHRHNVGQAVLDRIAQRLGARWIDTPQGATLECVVGSEKIVFLKPATSMNLSGEAVAAVQSARAIAIRDIFVFYDEVDLSPGRLKLKSGGGTAGHNGLGSISAAIGGDYRKVRIGIGRPQEGHTMRDHVLGNFAKQDQIWLAPLANAIADELEHLTQGNHDTFLNHVARTTSAPKPTTTADEKADWVSTKARGLKRTSELVTQLLDNVRNQRLAMRTAFRGYQATINRSSSGAKFIAITGSSAKTSTANLIAHILRGHGNVLVQAGHNTLFATYKTLKAAQKEYDYVIMELGASGPGTIRPMAKLARPDIAVITTVGMDHYSAFRSQEAIAQEKGSLLEELRADGIAILNGEDSHVAAMAGRTNAKVVRYGAAGSDYASTQIDASKLGGLELTLDYHGRSIRLKTQLTGAHNRLAVSAAAACALELGVPEQCVIDRIASFQPVFNRMSVHRIPDGPIFLLDARKAPCDTLHLSIDALKAFDAPRKRFILGGLSDYPGDPTKKFRDAYRMAREAADQVIFIGRYAHHSKATQAERDAETFVEFHNVELLSKYLKKTAIQGEVILLKAPANIHLERLMFDWTMPVRCWETQCGKRDDCMSCGLISRPFNQHFGRRQKQKWYQRSNNTPSTETE